MECKLRFTFKVIASPRDRKTNVIAITLIKTEENTSYILPQDMIHVGEHVEIMETEVYKRVRKSLSQRGQERSVWITLKENLKHRYLDEEGNIIFNDIYLEQVVEENKIGEPARKKENQLETFEKECRRFDIEENIDKIETSRLCIDFRDLNKIIIPQAQPFPLINDLIIKTRN
ncbi:hypothetical protein PV328_012370, partial [Microctonus aethiopoides]